MDVRVKLRGTTIYRNYLKNPKFLFRGWVSCVPMREQKKKKKKKKKNDEKGFFFKLDSAAALSSLRIGKMIFL